MLWMRKNSKAATYAQQERAALLGFLAELPNFLATIVACILTNSIIVWSDFVSSLQSTMHYGIVTVISHRLKADTIERYNFGVERIDVFASLVCDFLMLISFAGLIGYSFYGFLNPDLPSDNLYLFLILKASNIGFDVFFVLQQLSIRRKTHSRINETELTACVSYLLDDCVTMAVALIVYFFRSNTLVGYLGPVYCLLSSIYFSRACIKHMRGAIVELTDRALPFSDQDKIVDILLAHKSEYQKIIAVNSRSINRMAEVQLELQFHENTSYGEQLAFLSRITTEIQLQIKDCNVSLLTKSAEITARE